jgi:hypothetical protein
MGIQIGQSSIQDGIINICKSVCQLFIKLLLNLLIKGLFIKAFVPLKTKNDEHIGRIFSNSRQKPSKKVVLPLCIGKKMEKYLPRSTWFLNPDCPY